MVEKVERLKRFLQSMFSDLHFEKKPHIWTANYFRIVCSLIAKPNEKKNLFGFGSQWHIKSTSSYFCQDSQDCMTRFHPYHTPENTAYFKIKCFKQKQHPGWMSPGCIPRFYSHRSKTTHRGTGGKLGCWAGHRSALSFTEMWSPATRASAPFHLLRLWFLLKETLLAQAEWVLWIKTASGRHIVEEEDAE